LGKVLLSKLFCNIYLKIFAKAFLGSFDFG
jgi:hypothetical protein